MCACVLQVEISKNYSRADWRDDLKRLLRRAGCDGKRIMFLFCDSQIKDEAFVEDINNMLNAGEVPNMFPSDEKMQVGVLQPSTACCTKPDLLNPLTAGPTWKLHCAYALSNLARMCAHLPAGHLLHLPAGR